MVDLAELGIRVLSDEVSTADQRLDSLTRSASSAEGELDQLAAAARRSDGAISTMNVTVREQARLLQTTQNAMGLTANESLNLSRQFADVGVTLASGMNPALVALQQGPQLFEIFQVAAIRSGVTIRAAMMATGAAIWTALAPLIPLIAGIAVVAGTTAAAFGLATRSMSSEIGDVTKGMNLSEAQMKRLKEQGVSSTITMGDYFRGLGTTIKEMFVSTFGDQLSWVSRQWNDFLDMATRAAFLAVQSIGTAFVGTYYAVRDTWKLLPAAMGDAAVSAANAAAKGINWLIQKAVDGLNALMSHYNSLPEWMRNGTTAPVLNAPQFGTLDNPYAGGLTAAGDAVASGYGRAWDQVGGGMRRFQDQLQNNVEASAIARNRKAAGDAGASGADGATMRAAQDVAIELEAFERVNISPLIVQVSELVPQLELAADEMRLIDQLAQDSARGMASAFGDTGRALGDLLTTMTGYENRLAQIDVAEQRKQLSAAQAERERAYAQIANYGDMLGAAKGFFQEGSDGYRALQAAEAAYRVFQFAMSVQAMAMGAAETSAHVAQSGTRAAASTAAGAANIFEKLGPYGFPVVAAMLALLASLGMKGKGGGGGSASVDGSVAKSQSYAQQADASQSMFAASVAQKVEVKVTADRDGLNAYVAQTARQEAAPMVAQGMAAASGATRAQVFADLDKSRTYSRGG